MDEGIDRHVIDNLKAVIISNLSNLTCEEVVYFVPHHLLNCRADVVLPKRVFDLRVKLLSFVLIPLILN